MDQPREICVYCSRPTSSRCSGRNNVLLSALHTIRRYALRDDGVVGSMYDAWTDTILPSLAVSKNLLIHENLHEIPACHLVKVDGSTQVNLLDAIGIHDDLRLSIALSINQTTAGTLLLSTFDLLPNRTIRCIDYCHADHKVSLSTDMQVARSTLSCSLIATGGTHIVTSVTRGIDFVMVVEFARNDHLAQIDGTFEQLCEYFKNPKDDILPTVDQEMLHDLTVTIFTQSSQLRSFAEKNNLNDIFRSITQLILSGTESSTLLYTLHPVKCIYFDGSYEDRFFHQLDPWIVEKIEQKILPISNKLRTIQRVFFQDVSSQLSPKLSTLVNQTHGTMQRVVQMFKTLQRRLANIVTDCRRGQLNAYKLDAELNNAQTADLSSELEALEATLLRLQAKAQLIIQLCTDHHIDYVNVADLEDSGDDLESLQAKLYSRDQQQHRCYLCSSTSLIEKNHGQHERLCQELIQRCSDNPSFHPVFGDFSYCVCPLTQMQIFQPSTARSEEINILLVGETGVGKSTFINAFVNYLAYRSLSEAENGEPVVLIPTSFLITTGDQFQEKQIVLGQLDPNEDHNHSGQSVTQHCRSYIFRISNEVKLRIIDTPGMGDTRGIEQDIRNIEQITSYITNLSHLNAVCFLLKPNTVRLHALFRLCFSQLFDFLAPNVRENIIFCFTNTRATFYAPGETLPALKAMINQLPENRKPAFGKANTFCFDSESFRYLAVVKAGEKPLIDDDQRLDFANSWRISMKESIRLLAYIQGRPKHNITEDRSIRHAKMMIAWLARPLVETIRNVLRNLTRIDKPLVVEIEVQSKSQATDTCASYPSRILKVDDFWTMEHPLNQHRMSNEGFPAFYELQCLLVATKDIQFISSAEKMKDRLLSASVAMTQFLLQTDPSHFNPFLSWFDLLLHEEDTIHAQYPYSAVNAKLCHNLRQVKSIYERNVQDNPSARANVNLDAIYERIEEVLSYPVVSKQLDAIRKSQIAMMKHHERDVSSQYPHISVDRLMTLSSMVDPRN